MKNCSSTACTQNNPQHIDCFYKRHSRKSGYASECKKCTAMRQKNYRKNNPERLARWQKGWGLSRLYFKDMSPKEALAAWDKMFVDQQVLCDLCAVATATDVDHDHKSGKIRGLLCNPCNLLLGKVEKRPWFMSRASLYLESSK